MNAPPQDLDDALIDDTRSELATSLRTGRVMVRQTHQLIELAASDSPWGAVEERDPRD